MKRKNAINSSKNSIHDFKQNDETSFKYFSNLKWYQNETKIKLKWNLNNAFDKQYKILIKNDMKIWKNFENHFDNLFENFHWKSWFFFKKTFENWWNVYESLC